MTMVEKGEIPGIFEVISREREEGEKALYDKFASLITEHGKAEKCSILPRDLVEVFIRGEEIMLQTPEVVWGKDGGKYRALVRTEKVDIMRLFKTRELDKKDFFDAGPRYFEVLVTLAGPGWKKEVLLQPQGAVEHYPEGGKLDAEEVRALFALAETMEEKLSLAVG